LLWLMVVVVVVVGMYVLWQGDRALLALRLSQMQVRAMKAESTNCSGAADSR
jgi:hypothetical protein